jgi:hypothetical protein
VQCIHGALAGHGAGGNPWQNAGDICTGEHCDHPGYRTSRRHIDTA